MSSFTRDIEPVETALTSVERNYLIQYLCNDHSFSLNNLLEWLMTLRDPAFWETDIENKELNYSSAQALYLNDFYQNRHGQTYESDLSLMAELMWEGRFDAAHKIDFGVHFSPQMDAALMMLAEHIEHFKVLYEFDQSKFRGVLTSIDEVMLYVNVIKAQPTSNNAAEFAIEWLSFHLLYYSKAIRVTNAKKQIEKRESEDGSAKVDVEPGAE